MNLNNAQFVRDQDDGPSAGGVCEILRRRLIEASEDGILSVVGHTPVIKLARLSRQIGFNIHAKLEMLNPGGSIKDRPALSILKHAILNGEINEQTHVVEASSGNFAIGLAQICAFLRLKLTCVLDARATPQSIKLLRAYGANVEQVTKPDPESGEFLQACIKKVQQLRESEANTFWPNQHNNLQNPQAHKHTMREIVEKLGKVDYLFCATSTCGTLRGCKEFIDTHGLSTKIVAVDADGSRIFKDCQKKRLIPGHGAGKPPGLVKDDHYYDELVYVTPEDSVTGCRKLLDSEAIMAGGSSGGIWTAVERMASKIEPDAVIVMIICDRGERYIDTIYCDGWLAEHLPGFH